MADLSLLPLHSKRGDSARKWSELAIDQRRADYQRIFLPVLAWFALAPLGNPT